MKWGKMEGNNSRSDVLDWVFSHISLHKQILSRLECIWCAQHQKQPQILGYLSYNLFLCNKSRRYDALAVNNIEVKLHISRSFLLSLQKTRRYESDYSKTAGQCKGTL